MGTMFVWSSPALNYLDPDYCQGQTYHCDLELSKQQAVWVNAIAFLGCIISVPLAGQTSNTLLCWHHRRISWGGRGGTCHPWAYGTSLNR